MTTKIETFNPVLNYQVAGTNASVATAIAQPPAFGTSGTSGGVGGQNYGGGNAGGYDTVRFYNPNAYPAFAAWSNGTATAATTGVAAAPIPASGSVTYNMGAPATSIAVILSTASAGTIYISVGSGGA